MSNSKLKFHPKASNWGLKTYDLIIEIKKGYPRPVLDKIKDIYFNIFKSNISEIQNSFERIKLTESDEALAIELSNAFESSPLKKINNLVIKILSGSIISSESIKEAIEAMLYRKPIYRSARTTIDIKSGVMDDYALEKMYTSQEVVQIDENRVKEWLSQVATVGIDEAILDSKWGDHELGKYDEWKGRRAVKLSYKGRLIYYLEKVLEGDKVWNRVIIERITTTHNYLPDS